MSRRPPEAEAFQGVAALASSRVDALVGVLARRFDAGSLATSCEFVAVVVPSRRADGTLLDHGALVERVERKLSKLFGGTLSMAGRGSDVKDPMPEVVTVVVSYMTAATLSASAEALGDLVDELITMWGQRAVFIVSRMGAFCVQPVTEPQSGQDPEQLPTRGGGK